MNNEADIIRAAQLLRLMVERMERFCFEREEMLALADRLCPMPATPADGIHICGKVFPVGVTLVDRAGQHYLLSLVPRDDT